MCRIWDKCVAVIITTACDCYLIYPKPVLSQDWYLAVYFADLNLIQENCKCQFRNHVIPFWIFPDTFQCKFFHCLLSNRVFIYLIQTQNWKKIDCMFPCTHTLRYYLQSDGTYQDFTGNHEITSKRKSRGSYLMWHPLISRCCMIRFIQRLLE